MDDMPARIAAERRRLGLSQEGAAGRLGISRGTYAQVESARGRNPSYEMLAQLVEVLGMDPRNLVPDWFATPGPRDSK